MLHRPGHLTDVRTACVGALAAKHLAPKHVSSIGVVGTGIQARLQLKLLVELGITDCRTVVLWGRNPANARACADDMAKDCGVAVTVVESVREVAQACNLIVTTTSSTAPLLLDADVQPGTHITAMGSDGIGEAAPAPRPLCCQCCQCCAVLESGGTPPARRTRM